MKFIQEKKLIGECFCLCHSHIYYNYSFFFFLAISLCTSTCHLFSFGKAKKIPCLGRRKEVKKVKGIIIIIIIIKTYDIKYSVGFATMYQKLFKCKIQCGCLVYLKSFQLYLHREIF